MDNQEIEKAKNEIANNNEVSVIEDLLRRNFIDSIKDDIYSIKYRLNRSKNDWESGVISTDDYSIERVRIANSLFETLTEVKKHRAEYFLECLDVQNFEITPELATDPDFAHAFSQTMHVVLNTRREDKIKYFSNLIRNNFKEGEKPDLDNFELNLQILDNLSYTEIQLLILLLKFEFNHGEDVTVERERLKLNSYNWLKFLAIVEKEMHLDKETCEAYLSGIVRTGMINFQKPRLNDMRHYGACTTILFWELYDKISLT